MTSGTHPEASVRLTVCVPAPKPVWENVAALPEIVTVCGVPSIEMSTVSPLCAVLVSVTRDWIWRLVPRRRQDPVRRTMSPHGIPPPPPVQKSDSAVCRLASVMAVPEFDPLPPVVHPPCVWIATTSPVASHVTHEPLLPPSVSARYCSREDVELVIGPDEVCCVWFAVPVSTPKPTIVTVSLTGGFVEPRFTFSPCAWNGIRLVWLFGKTLKRPQSFPTPPSTNSRLATSTEYWSCGPGCTMVPSGSDGGTLNSTVSSRLDVETQCPAVMKQDSSV